MKICFIAPANNYHTQKWCNWFSKQGHDVHVISFTDATIKNVKVHWIDSRTGTQESDGRKLKYLLQAPKIKRIVKEIDPDIINVHYATSYGTATALSGIKKYILSVWGTDIYEFPNKSLLHRLMLKFSLRKATYLFSTSNVMAKEASKYTDKPFEITPFGVNIDMFSSNKRDRMDDGNFVVGTVKALEPKYGIDCLLRAVSIIRREHPEVPIKLRIAGKGSNENEYKELANKLEIRDITTWLGFISQEEVAKEWANMDLIVIFSSFESFGVSAIEAQACETPLIISDAPGLMEATCPGITSIVVPRGNDKALADAIFNIYHCPEKREKMKKMEREYVSKRYELNNCFTHIENIFEKLL